MAKQWDVLCVGGIDVRHSPIYDIAEIVGLVQQDPEAQFCTLYTRDEVAFGLENRCLPRNEIKERMTWALGIVSANHLMDRPMSTLSGGEKQKVAIAAMMATKPQILIFDEPTSNLDPTATTEIFDVIEHIRAEAHITVIVIEHKVDYLQRFKPRLVKMQAGQIVTDRSRIPGVIYNNTRYSPQYSKDSASVKPLVRVNNLHAGYKHHPVLHGLTLEISRGEFVSVMGDNGSGKTTFLKCLLGLHKPSDGRVEVLGYDTQKTLVSDLARYVGFVFQNPNHQIFAESVWEEATLAPRNFGVLDQRTRVWVSELLERSGLHNRRGDHPYRLSLGEKRRLNMISVLAYKPELILLDEVLIGQDPDNASFLMELLCEYVEQGGTVVLVNHAPLITRIYSNRVIFLNKGQLAVDAPTGEAFARLQALGRNAYVV